ncbi:hypothetical protein ABID92_000448 [Frigoribacterium sp. PvP120]|uniref:hypothetical protein n=1 Tax=unclassified Frigoribacterium TaxID=2627005 RepID=UPI001AE7E3D7|nr:hypothetical protein [Frigoribacterium sp. PvP121]MBP1241724.1 hypothetical protein [Frigoribacterium sp. PvP121]
MIPDTMSVDAAVGASALLPVLYLAFTVAVHSQFSGLRQWAQISIGERVLTGIFAVQVLGLALFVIFLEFSLLLVANTDGGYSSGAEPLWRTLITFFVIFALMSTFSTLVGPKRPITP